jgi:uncharacterized protein YndB with AHSA1/START domain
MPVMHFYIEVDRPMGKVFQLITDLAHYKDWLPASKMYSEVINISDNPVRQGTTYIDKGKTFMMAGEVTEMHPPSHISFQQELRVRILFFSLLLKIQTQYTLVNIDRRTRVTRATTMKARGLLFALFGSRIAERVRRENERILEAMKTYLEAQN